MEIVEKNMYLELKVSLSLLQIYCTVNALAKAIMPKLTLSYINNY